MKPFKSTFLALFLVDLKEVTKLIADLSLFLGLFSHLGLVELHEKFPAKGLTLGLVGIFLYVFSMVLVIVYHFFKRRYEEQ